jgi:deoxyribodipyrimidine photo-lyase
MSKYLHYGHVSPIYVALKVRDANPPQEDLDSYLEELIIRRELSMNFCHYTPDYDQFSCLPNWAKKTLEEHKDDEREYLYTREQLENAETHDEYWNAATNEMRHTGYMHNYMRMYWAVFGKVRYMSAGGLERKAKPKQYVEKVRERIEDSE